MEDILSAYRETLELESKMLNTPDSCTINRAMELVYSAYTLGNQKSEEQKLREKYAGMAMQSIISDRVAMERMFAELQRRGDEEGVEMNKVVAERAVEFADALIEVLKK